MNSETTLEDSRIEHFSVMPAPADIKGEAPLSEAASAAVRAGREAVRAILEHGDPRLFVVVGPCSMHDPVACMEYARRLRALADELSPTLR